MPGRVSTEVDADLSFDVRASVARAEQIIQDYSDRQIGRERILVKLASTWEGIRAAEELQKKGIDCNLTLLFQQGAGDRLCRRRRVPDLALRRADLRLVQEVDRQEPTRPRRIPGVLSVRGIYNYYKANGIPTVVMGASFRSTGQIEALAGCDRLTIAPNFLEELAASDGPLERKLSPDGFEPEAAVEMDERRFRWEMNEDAMATEMLASGIRAFAKDLGKLREIVRQKLN